MSDFNDELNNKGYIANSADQGEDSEQKVSHEDYSESQELLDAADEAERISRDPDVQGYTDMNDLKEALESPDDETAPVQKESENVSHETKNGYEAKDQEYFQQLQKEIDEMKAKMNSSDDKVETQATDQGYYARSEQSEKSTAQRRESVRPNAEHNSARKKAKPKYNNYSPIDSKGKKKPQNKAHRNSSFKTWAARACALVLCAGVGALGSAAYMNFTGGGNMVVNTTEDTASETSADNSKSAVAVTKKMTKSVVAITTENIQTSHSWFGSEVSGGAGSGVIISKNGYIVTCAHVVNGASKIGVTTADKKKYTAKLIGMDAKADVAVLKINANGLTPATIADSSKIQQGQKVYAVGNPQGILANSVTSGIVSAKDRKITLNLSSSSSESEDDDDSDSSLFGDFFGGSQEQQQSQPSSSDTMDVIQTDAAVSPGNSGGGLFDDNGNLIGIVNAKVSNSNNSNVEGLSFAIPSSTVFSKVKSIMNNRSKYHHHEDAGVSGQNQVQMP